MRTVTLLASGDRVHPLDRRGLICAQLAADSAAPLGLFVDLFDHYRDPKAQPSGGRPLTDIRVATELEDAGVIRIAEWPVVEVLIEPTADVPPADLGPARAWVELLFRLTRNLREEVEIERARTAS